MMHMALFSLKLSMFYVIVQSWCDVNQLSVKHRSGKVLCTKIMSNGGCLEVSRKRPRMIIEYNQELIMYSMTFSDL